MDYEQQKFPFPSSESKESKIQVSTTSRLKTRFSGSDRHFAALSSQGRAGKECSPSWGYYSYLEGLHWKSSLSNVPTRGIRFQLTKLVGKGWGRGSVGKGLTAQEDLSSIPRAHRRAGSRGKHFKSQQLRRPWQAGPWGSLASEFPTLRESLTCEEPRLRKQGRWMAPEVPGLHKCVNTPPSPTKKFWEEHKYLFYSSRKTLSYLSNLCKIIANVYCIVLILFLRKLY